MFCPSCGAVNRQGSAFCNSCGTRLPRLSAPVTCPFCGADGQEYEPKCTKCGRDLTRVPGAVQRPGSAVRDEPLAARTPVVAASGRVEEYRGRRTDIPKVAGVMIITAGVLGIVYGLQPFGVLNSYGYVESATLCAVLIITFGIIAILGGFSAIGRDSGLFAVIGGVCGILSIGFYIGALISLIGLLLVASSYREFQD